MAHTGIQLKPNENGTMSLDIKVIRDSNGMIASGLVVGDLTFQNQALILQYERGELKESPAVGCGINGLASDDDIEEWKRTITKQIEADGQRISELEISSSSFKMEAKYI